MKETQLLKGVLEGCVLDMIGQKERVSVFWQQWDDLSQKVEGIKNGG